MDTQNMPPIDRTAEEATVATPHGPAAAPLPPGAPVIPPRTAADAAPPMPPPAGDVPLPSIENAPPMVFRPVHGIGAVDMIEIALVTLLQVSGASVRVEKGALRLQAISAERAMCLSDEALKHMAPLTVTHTTEGQ